MENWEDMEKVFEHIFYNEFRVAPEELKGIMVTEPPGNPKQCAEKMTQVLFETFWAQNIYFAFQPRLAVFEKGRDMGLVVDVGFHSTTVFRYGLRWGSEPIGPWRLEIAG